MTDYDYEHPASMRYAVADRSWELSTSTDVYYASVSDKTFERCYISLIPNPFG